MRKVNLDRYDDRDLVRTNLIESYERIIAFVRKHLPDPFFLEGMERISLRDAIFREVASNILIHREYTNAFPAKLIIECGQVRTENSNKSNGFGPLDPAKFTPFPKNPVIGAFFREIHRADELGSGMRKLMRYGKTYGGTAPQMIEGDIFRIVVKVPEFHAPKKESAAPENNTQITPKENRNRQQSPPYKTHNGIPNKAQDKVHDKVHDEVHEPISKIEQRILLACFDGPQSTATLLALLGYKSRPANYRKAISRLINIAYLEMTIPDKPRSKKQKYRLTKKGQKALSVQP